MTGNDFVHNIVISAATKSLRSILNGAVSKFSPSDINKAILNDESLWGAGEGDIRGRAGQIPYVHEYGKTFVNKISQDYGSVTALVVMWLKEDQKLRWSMIQNTPGGVEWLDRQVREILDGLGLAPNSDEEM